MVVPVLTVDVIISPVVCECVILVIIFFITDILPAVFK